jgi:hypothetical protein
MLMRSLKYFVVLGISCIVLMGAGWPVSMLYGKWMYEDKELNETERMVFNKDGTFSSVLTDKEFGNDSLSGMYYLKDDFLYMKDKKERDTIKVKILQLSRNKLVFIETDSFEPDTFFFKREN